MLAYTAPLRLVPRNNSESRSKEYLGHTISKEEGDRAFNSQQGYYSGSGPKQKVYRIQKLAPMVDENGEVQVDQQTGLPREAISTEYWVFDVGTEAGIEAMKSAEADNWWMTFMRGLNQMQRFMIVTSPSFRAKVVGRDNVERAINTAVGNSAQQYFDVMKGTVTDPVTGKDEDLDRLFDLSGAGMAGWNQMGYDQAQAEILAHVEHMKGEGWNVTTPGGLWRAWQRVGEMAENVARKAEFAEAFRRARKPQEQGGMGLEKLDAALYAMSQARGLLDTAESGRTIAQINGFTLFLNAGIKGFQRNTMLARAAIKAAKAGDMATVRRTGGVLVARITAIGLATAALRIAELLRAEDDDERKRMLREPAWKRDFSWRVDLPFVGKVAIAKPYEMGWVLSGFERLADAQLASGRGWQEDADRAFEGYGKSFLGAVLPIKPSEVLGGSFMPIIETMFNFSSFTGGSIIPGYERAMDVELRKGTERASPDGVRCAMDTYPELFADA
ncbi:MAG: hypothetical protein BWY85_00001 [Firmicutes bacterium ADurb.Bin506]|nr:MAG: hypothetical protein BWY85_00001 [Firmicutes bacterium ADurb.Bin506]